jgi:hypothetical protein
VEDSSELDRLCWVTPTLEVERGGALRVKVFVPGDVAAASEPLSAQLHWRVGFKAEVPVPMDDGGGGEHGPRGLAATLPPEAVSQSGSLVRWRVAVRNTSGRLLCGIARCAPAHRPTFTVGGGHGERGSLSRPLSRWREVARCG